MKHNALNIEHLINVKGTIYEILEKHVHEFQLYRTHGCIKFHLTFHKKVNSVSSKNILIKIYDLK